MLPVWETAVTIDVDGLVCDTEAARLLPWFVTGRLSATDAERVTQHLEHCEICRVDLADQRALRATLRTSSPVEYAPQAGLAKTMARIDELAREPASGFDNAAARRPDSRARQRRFGVTQWLTAAVVLQAIGLGAVGGSYFVRQPADRGKPGYETLSSPAAAANGARIRAVFAEGMTVGRLKELLAAQQLLIVAGPTEAGVFTLGATAAHDRAQWDVPLAALRADPHVLFAEPVAGDGVSPR
jgi:hypothetical protein